MLTGQTILVQSCSAYAGRIVQRNALLIIQFSVRTVMNKKSSDVVSALLNGESVTPQLATENASTPSVASGRASNDYVELKKLIKKDGLLDKQPVYYTYKIIATLG